jgi:DNA-directed RNA polymerase subunit RPC12/RpoP
MPYVCIECGHEVDYEYLMQHKLKCTKCKEKRSNIWVKKNKGSPRPVKSE